MVRSVLSSFVLAAMTLSSPLAQAISFRYPKSADDAHSVNLSLLKGDTVNVTWDTVATDPEKFSLYLWEFVNYPPTYELVAYNVNTETRHASLKVPCNITSSSNWQLTMIEGTNIYILYAQTARFNIKDRKGPCVASPPHPEKYSSSSSYSA